LEILKMFHILQRIWCKAWWPGLIKNLYLSVAISQLFVMRGFRI
jgi:hypothetical protein